jgi:hypothetical protein
LIKSENDFIFGGFTSSSSFNELYGVFIHYENTFIFTLSNPSNKLTKLKCVEPQNSIYNKTFGGPCFGYNGGIYIYDNSNIKNNNFANIERSYKNKNVLFFIFFIYLIY